MKKPTEKYIKEIFNYFKNYLNIDNVKISKDNRIKAVACVKIKGNKYHIKYNYNRVYDPCQIKCFMLHEMFHIRCYKRFKILDVEKQEYFAERAMLFYLKNHDLKSYKTAIADNKRFLANKVNKLKWPDHYRAFDRVIRMQK